MWVRLLGQKDPLQTEIATHSSGGFHGQGTWQATIGLQRVGHE